MQKKYYMGPAQKRLFALEQAQEMSTTYNVPLLFTTNTKIDKQKFESALGKLHERHELLRTSFACEKDIFMQIVNSNVEIDFVYCEKQNINIDEEVEAFIKPFDIENAPLVRTKLLFDDVNNISYVIIDIHHIVYDGGSYNTLVGDLLSLYEGKSLNEQKFQFKDFVAWQIKQNQNISEQYWLNEFSDEPPVLEIITDYQRGQVQSFEGDTVKNIINGELLESIKRYAEIKKVSPYVVTLSALKILISKYANQKETVIGTPVSGRTLNGTENLLGMFVNTLAIRSEIDNEDTFDSYINKINAKTFESISNQDYQFDELVEKLGGVKDKSRNPIFDILFAYQNNIINKYQIDGHDFTPIVYENKTSKFDISVNINEKLDHLEVEWNYKTSLYSKTTIMKIAAHYNKLLSNLLIENNKKISNVNLLLDEEIEMLKNIMSEESTISCDINSTIVERFKEVVTKHENEIALMFGDEKITYNELNKMSNVVANHLISLELKIEECVGIVCEPSINTFVAILGVLKAGGAYVPLDAKIPTNRVEFIVESSKIKNIIINDNYEHVEEINEFANLMKLEEMPLNESEVTSIIYSPGSLAYVIYTSGTTGNPKGVMIENSSVINLVDWKNKFGNLSTNTRVLQHFNYAFDASVWEIFPSILSGATLEIISSEVKNNPSELLNLLPGAQITVTPSFFRLLLDYAIDKNITENLINVDKIYFAAEPLDKLLLDQLIEIGVSMNKFFNCYGPTESTVCCTAHKFVNSDDIGGNIIGKAIENTSILIMNEGCISGVGIPGEICVAGLGLARGYINQPELTDEKFINHPYKNNERIYRTGDLGRLDKLGNIEYIGRIDEQVKVRGFRVEVKEIEEKIREIEEIDDVICVKKIIDNSEYLCGYVISKHDVNANVIKEYLKSYLPDYMIPTFITQLTEIPVTRNGKINKKALPIPKLEKSSSSCPARNDQEIIMIDVFKNILGISELGIDHDFFEMGGDSIKAIRIVSKLRERNINVDIKSILEYRSIRNISQTISSNEEDTRVKEMIVGDVIPTPIQSIFLNTDIINKNYFNQAMILESNEKLEMKFVIESWEKIVEYHDMLRAKVHNKKIIVDKYEKGKFFDICEYEISHLNEGSYIKSFIEEKANEIHGSIDIERGPLVKIALFHINNTDYMFICIHHLVIDGISWRILVDDLNNIYGSLKNSKKINMPQHTCSSKEWSNFLSRLSDEKEISSEVEYWRNIDKNIKENPFVITKENKEYKPKLKEFMLSKDETVDILNNIRKSYPCSILEFLMTAVLRGMKDLSNKTTLALNMETHGRDMPDNKICIDRTVGWFTGTYPIIVKNIGDNTRLDLGNVRKTIKEVPNNGMGYNILKIYKEEEFSDPDITFNYLGEFINEASEGIFKHSSMPIGEEIDINNKFGSEISINALVIEGIMEFKILYNKATISDTKIDKLANNIKFNITSMLKDCSDESKFPFAYKEMIWSDKELENLNSYICDSGYGIEKIYPLTPMQEGILLQSLLPDTTSNYAVQCTYKVEDDVNIDILEKSIKLLPRKHEVLRSRIMHKGYTEPRQVVLDGAEVEFDVIRLNSEETIENYTFKDKKRGFDVESDSLMRISFVTTDREEKYMVYTFHHAMMDGWCLSILLSDIFNFYKMIEKGIGIKEIDSEINSAKTSYEDFVRYYLEKDYNKGLLYWEKLLDGYDSYSGLEPSLRKSEETVSKTDKYTAALSTEETNKLLNIVKKHGVTLNTIIEAAWGLILQKYNFSKDVVFGKIVSGRNYPSSDVDSIVGLFINMIPVRVQSKDNTTILEILKQVQKQAIHSNNFDNCSLADIQLRSLAQQNLIQTMIAFENYYEASADENNEIKMNLIDAKEETHYSLSLSVHQTDRINFKLLYDTGLYKKSDMDKLIKRLKNILVSMIEDVNLKIGEIYCVENAERDKIFCENRLVSTNYPIDNSIVELFKHQVQLNPMKEALIQDNKIVTYKELDQQSDIMASIMQKNNIKEKDVVAFIAEKQIDTIVLILAILKLGATYLPLDPKYPSERINYIINDSQAAALIYYDKLIDAITIENAISIKSLKESTESSLEFNSKFKNDITAYIMYTSGTTGNPKGVQIKQKSIIRLVKNTNYCDFNDMKVLQAGSIAFDAATFEIWGTLLNGGYLYITNDECFNDTEVFKDTVEKNKLNTMFITTALFNHLLDIDNNVFNKLTQVLMGGEKASENHIELFLNSNKNTKLIHVYGPTENTTFTTYYNIIGKPIGQVTPIGKPISNTKVFLLDAYNHICGDGMSGEICISGDGLTDGYLKCEELTSEKFFIHPLIEGEVLYHSGDIGRLNSNGDIEYVRRIDEQVKIRGFRIELNEISHKLKQIKGIKDAVVIDTKVSDGLTLSAYVVTECSIDIIKIKEELSVQLPSYMIPSQYFEVNEIPITVNGKLDRNKLKAIASENSSREIIKSRNDTEEVIVNIFKEILNLQEVSIDDNFYDIGGHSLRATRLANRIEQEFGIRLSLKLIFELGTTELIANKISEQIPDSNSVRSLINIANHDNFRKVYPLGSAQNKIYILQGMHEDNISYNIPSVFEIDGKIDILKLEESLNRLIERHELLRTEFISDTNGLVQRILDKVDFKLEYKEDNIENYHSIFNNFVKPFNLSKAPLIRGLVVKVSENKHLLFVDLHHIISDGASTNIWTKELSALYNSEELPAIKVQYKDYVIWDEQRSLHTQKEYWTKELDSELPVLDIRSDYPRPKIQSNKGKSFFTEIDPEVKDMINEYCRSNGVTEYMVLLSTFTLLLNKYSRQNDIIVGTPMSGRVISETENMFGMFVNTLPIRTKLNNNMIFDDLVKTIKYKCLDAYDNQEYPFENIVDDLQIERDTSRNPIFSAMFALQNNEEENFKLGDSIIKHKDFDSDISKFDLTLSMNEHSGGYKLYWEYSSDLYKEETVNAISKHYLNLLKASIMSPKKELNKISMLSDIERNKILKEFNLKEQNTFRGETAVTIFEEQVSLYPDNDALIFNDKSMTYRELNDKANYIANMLVSKGITRNDIVGIVLDKSFELYISMLGILKAGAAYLPIDPSYPEDRIEYMISDSKSKIILSSSEHDNTSLENVECIKLDEIEVGVGVQLDPIATESDLIYTIYTSGTTGRPKGVLIEHKSIVNFARWQQYNGNMTSEIVFLQNFNTVFDGAAYEIYPTLLVGGALKIMSEADRKSPQKILKEIGGAQAIITPSMFSLLIDYAEAFDKIDSLNAFDKLYLGGESVPSELIEKYKNISNGKINDVYNCYGPTEATICATCKKYYHNEDLNTGSIGQPIWNTRVVIINNEQLCGIGIPGEVCISGVGLARGYTNNEELTRQKFTYNEDIQERIYHTGDLAYLDGNGNVIFLGRIDEQVKVRGFRIELKEIEAEIKNVNGVKEAYVTTYLRNSSDKILVAYVIGREEVSQADIKDHLKSILPDYMIPESITFMDRFPLTINGKLDKRSLPEPKINDESEYVEPMTELELKLTQLFSNILNIDKVSVTDDFFSIGGHSLNATKLSYMVERELNMKLPLMEIFTNKSPEKIADYLEINSSNEDVYSALPTDIEEEVFDF